MPQERGVAPWWLLLTVAGAFGAVAWLRDPAAPVLGAGIGLAVVALFSVRTARAGTLGATAAGVLIAALAAVAWQQRRIDDAERDWTAYAQRVEEESVAWPGDGNSGIAGHRERDLPGSCAVIVSSPGLAETTLRGKIASIETT